MSNKNEIWDPAKVEEFRELSELSGESVFGRLYEVYRDETPEQLIRLGVHMENEEWLQARELAHHMMRCHDVRGIEDNSTHGNT